MMLNNFRRPGDWVIDKFSEHPIPRDVGDFRLIDRKVIEALSGIRTPHPYLRGMIASLGFNQTGIPYDRDARVAGESKINVNRLLSLGITAVINHSPVPLRAASFLGAAIIAISVLGSLYYVILRLIYPVLARGLACSLILVFFGFGLISLLL